jgi:hypothetical protein
MMASFSSTYKPGVLPPGHQKSGCIRAATLSPRRMLKNTPWLSF